MGKKVKNEKMRTFHSCQHQYSQLHSSRLSNARVTKKKKRKKGKEKGKTKGKTSEIREK